MGVDNPEGPRRLANAAKALGLQLRHVAVNSPLDFESAFKVAKEENAGALLVMEGPRAVANATLIGELGLRNRLPVMSHFRPIVEAGGLLAYGPALPDLFRRAATYVDKILNGTKPGELPIEQPTKYELLINLRTAKGLGLTLPPALLQRAGELIQ